MLPWPILPLSLKTLSILKVGLPYQTRGSWLSLSPETRLQVCPSEMTTPLAQKQTKRQYRLERYTFLSCAPKAVLADWIGAALAEGLTPDEADVVYFSQVLEDTGRSDEALALRRMKPSAAIWYVGHGQLSIALNQDEGTVKRHFQIAQDIDPTLDARKMHMYMYLCMEAIRNGKTSIIPHPCEDFEKVERGATSESLLGQKLVLQGEPEKAIGHLLRAIELDRNQPVPYYWAAMALLRLGDSAQGRQMLEDGNKLETKYPPLALELVRLDIREGCCAAAIKTLSALLSIEDPQIKSEIASMLDSIDGCKNTGILCE